ncbi:Uncharacterised protein [Bordetella pertussis]|nr:Uncharacterised protein [Bordetella pertussis]
MPAALNIACGFQAIDQRGGAPPTDAEQLAQLSGRQGIELQHQVQGLQFGQRQPQPFGHGGLAGRHVDRQLPGQDLRDFLHAVRPAVMA